MTLSGVMGKRLPVAVIAFDAAFEHLPGEESDRDEPANSEGGRVLRRGLQRWQGLTLMSPISTQVTTAVAPSLERRVARLADREAVARAVATANFVCPDVAGDLQRLVAPGRSRRERCEWAVFGP